MPNFAVVVRVAGADLDKCKVALPLEVAHGRSTTDSQPDAPSCTFTYLGDTPPGAVGDLVEVEVAGVSEGTWSDPDVLWTDVNVSWTGVVGRSLRFTGTISKIVAVEAENVIVGWAVEATGHQAKLGREPIKISRPQESDVDRVQAIAAAAGVSIEVIGATGPTLVADDIDRDALSALHEVCASSGGILWQQRDGTITYGTMYRHLSVPQWRLVCDMVLDGIEWTKDTGPVINHITVSRRPARRPPANNTGGWDWSSNTTIADPGTGNFRTNASPLKIEPRDLPDITSMALSAITNGGIDVSAGLAEYPTGTLLYVQQKSDSRVWALFRLTGQPIDRGGWFEVPVTYLQSGSGGTVTNNTPMILAFDTQGQGESEQDTFRDDDSIAQWGYRHIDIDTLCATAADSNLLGAALLARRAQPRWVMPGVVVLREKATDSAWIPMAQMDFAHTALIDVETAPTPTPGAMTPWTVEGWVETWEPTGRRVQLAVSEHNLGTPILWADADDQTWNHWATTASWLTALVEA